MRDEDECGSFALVKVKEKLKAELAGARAPIADTPVQGWGRL